jgi:acetylornithine deacetylase/succinyl-diaminopimelate desuccinylase-like protein
VTIGPGWIRLCFVLLLSPVPLSLRDAQGASPNRPMAHVRFLASEELRGREAGTPQADIAARYLAEQFRAMGLEVLPGAPDYLQEVCWQAEGSGPLRSSNVVGFIRGRDSVRAREVIVLVAHYDGQGVRTRDSVDTVLPGARDNAMGIAALLVAAEALAAEPCARSVLLLASTAEEGGMIGSKWFVDHSPLPLSHIVFVLNNDGAGMYEDSLWCIGGLELTTAEPLAMRAGRPFGLATQPYPEPLRGLYEKGDAISFARKGIPALTVSPGFQVTDIDRALSYNHKPTDRVDAAFDQDYLARFGRAYARLARKLANVKVVPVWRSPRPFG